MGAHAQMDGPDETLLTTYYHRGKARNLFIGGGVKRIGAFLASRVAEPLISWAAASLAGNSSA